MVHEASLQGSRLARSFCRSGKPNKQVGLTRGKPVWHCSKIQVKVKVRTPSRRKSIDGTQNVHLALLKDFNFNLERLAGVYEAMRHCVSTPVMHLL